MRGTVLVVDDDRDLSRVLAMLLRDEGYEVTTAGTGAAALTAAAERAYDVIVLDVVLPDQLGWEIMQQLRDRGDRARIVLTSGTRHAGVKARAYGADAFIAKPFDAGDVFAALQRAA